MLIEEYFTPNPDRIKYQYRLSDDDYLYTPSLLLEGNPLAHYRDSYNEKSAVYLKKDESRFFDSIINEYHLRMVQGILLNSFINMRIEDIIGRVDTENQKKTEVRRNEMKDLLELINLFNNDQISIRQSALITVTKDSQVKAFKFSSRTIHNIFSKHLFEPKQLESIKRVLEWHRAHELTPPNKGIFQSIRKRIQTEYAVLLYEFLFFIKEKSSQIYKVQVILSDSQIYTIVGKLMHLSQFSEKKGKLFTVLDSEYDTYVRKKFKKYITYLRKNQIE